MITFYEQSIGSSHISSNKPCQDSGLAIAKEGIHIAIVCDGHGSDSYVRSEVGSKLAAEVARDEILKFVESGATEFLISKKGRVTAVPTRNPLRDCNGKTILFEELSESEQEIVLQNKSYFNSVDKERHIEELFRRFFASIVEAWYSSIKSHLDDNPFSPKELEKVGARSIEKAYGSTLMAAVWTSDCWFAFHIGDGKLLAANELMEWSEPVPWDCNCFLNYTTSLCDSNPVDEFRYAYDGTGEHPLAFMLGSDGLDDTFIKNELLHNYYSQVLKLIGTMPCEEVLQLLRRNLSVLSEKGSHDDMSVAAIINEEALPPAIQYFDILQQVRSLNKERNQKEMDIAVEEKKINSLIKEIILSMQDHKNAAEHSLADYIKMLEVCQNELERLGDEQKSIKDKMTTLSSLMDGLQRMRESFDVWKQQGKDKIDSLRAQAEEIKSALSKNRINNQEPTQESHLSDGCCGDDKAESQEVKAVDTSPQFNTKQNDSIDLSAEKQQVEHQEMPNLESERNNSIPHSVDEEEQRRLDEESNAQFAELNNENNINDNIK